MNSTWNQIIVVKAPQNHSASLLRNQTRATDRFSRDACSAARLTRLPERGLRKCHERWVTVCGPSKTFAFRADPACLICVCTSITPAAHAQPQNNLQRMLMSTQIFKYATKSFAFRFENSVNPFHTRANYRQEGRRKVKQTTLFLRLFNNDFCRDYASVWFGRHKGQDLAD